MSLALHKTKNTSQFKSGFTRVTGGRDDSGPKAEVWIITTESNTIKDLSLKFIYSGHCIQYKEHAHKLISIKANIL